MIDRKNIDPFVDLNQLQEILAPCLGSEPSAEFVGLASDYWNEIEAFKSALSQPREE